MKLNIKFGETVYLKNDLEQKPYMCTGHLIRDTSVTYLLTYDGREITALDVEIQREKDLVTVMGLN